MRLGIMATTFARPTLEATLEALAACGVQSMQFDLACAGEPTLPAQIAPALCARIRDALIGRGAGAGPLPMARPPLARAAARAMQDMLIAVVPQVAGPQGVLVDESGQGLAGKQPCIDPVDLAVGTHGAVQGHLAGLLSPRGRLLTYSHYSHAARR